MLTTALATAEYLPQGAVWIRRQMKSDSINHQLVITNKTVNLDLFPHDNILTLGEASYLKRAIKHKLSFWFKHRPISLSNVQRKVLRTTLKEQGIDLVHAHFGTYGVYLMDVCEELNIPLLVTFHGFDLTSAPKRWPAYKKALTQLFDKITYALVISEDMANRIINMGCPPSKVKVSYLGVPTNQFLSIDRNGRNKLVFLHAGRLTEKKGVPDLISAFAKAFRNNESIELRIAGDGEELENVKQRILDEDIAPQIKMLGNLSQDRLKLAYAEADVFVLNSRTDSKNTKEGLPISILEACSAGLPVISTYHAGIPESIIHGETGILVDEYDTDALSQAMQELTAESTRTKFAKNARAFIEEKFDLETCNKALFDLYESAVQTSKPMEQN